MFRHFLTFLGRTPCVDSFVACARVVRFALSLFACKVHAFVLLRWCSHFLSVEIFFVVVVEDGHVRNLRA